MLSSLVNIIGFAVLSLIVCMWFVILRFIIVPILTDYKKEILNILN